MPTFLKNHVFQNALFLFALMLYILVGTPLVPLHGDETTQIYMGRDFYFQFVQRDLSRVLYSDTPELIAESAATEQHLRLLNGTLPKYLFGLAAYLGGYDISQLNGQWDWCCDWQYNFENGHIPSDDLLLRARWMSAVFLAAGAILMFWVGQAAGGRPVAYVASFYYALNPVLLLNGRRAMMEGSFVFFSLFVLWAGIVLIKTEKSSWKKILIAAVFLGIASGLAVASKHTAAIGVLIVFITCFLCVFSASSDKYFNFRVLNLTPAAQSATPPLLQERGSGGEVGILPDVAFGIAFVKLKNVILVFFAGMVALGVFYALNPAWWGNPIGRINTVLALRTDLLNGQTQFFGGYAHFADQSAGLFRQVFVALPQYYEVATWQNFIGDQIQAYEASFLQGVSIGGTLAGGSVLLLLMLTGIVVLGRDKTILPGVRGLLLAYGSVMPGLILLLTPLEWQRYYVPVYPAVGLLASVGLVGLIKIGQQAWQKRRMM